VNVSLKLLAVFSSILLILALISPASAQRKNDPAAPGFSPAPYGVGERLTFNVSFSSFVSVAHVQLLVAARSTVGGRDAIEIHAHVQTSGLINAALYSINNEYTTFVDPLTGMPLTRLEKLREGGRTSTITSDFTEGDTNGSKQRAGELEGRYDFLSALYRLRALPLNEGATYYFSARGNNNEDYQAELRVTGRQTVRTSVGSFDTVVSQIHVNNNSEANNYRIRIYFSDDDRHLPVLITAHHSSGEIRAELAGSDRMPQISPKASPTPPIAVATPAPLNVPQPPVTSVLPESLPFKVGEQLNYQVFVGNIATPVATATFQVSARSRYFDHDGLMLSVKAQTNAEAQRLFSASDEITSYVDPKTLLPFRNDMNLREGKRQLNQILTINQDYGSATTDSGGRFEVPVGTHDYLSFFYAMRTFSLTPPRRNAISIIVNNKPKTLFITSLKRETIALGSQRVPAIALSLTTDDPDSDKFVLRAWVSDDQRRLPLRLTAETEIGPVRADLVIIPVTRQ